MTLWHPPTPPGAAVARVSLAQGDVHFTSTPAVLETILGSCVSVCLWDRRRIVGGMTHFVLPRATKTERNGRYGDFAIAELLSHFADFGCHIADLQAKVFGGAEVMQSAGGRSIGASNVMVALEQLKAARILVLAQRTGGNRGQKIRFDTATGMVLFRVLANANQDAGQG